MDLSGKRFGNLTVKMQSGWHYYPNSKRKSVWLCVCDCGGTVNVVVSDLTNGHTQSCGCRRIRVATERLTRHGKSNSNCYKIWCAMKTRCYNQDAQNYVHYGGRGIKICKEWRDDYEAFYKWALKNGYRHGLTIDRIDVNGDYSPANCRWIPFSEQGLNKTNTRYIEYNGKKQSVKEWADEVGLKYSCLLWRLNAGWEPEKALFMPSMRHGAAHGTP